MKCLHSGETKKVPVEIVVSKLHGLTMRTRDLLEKLDVVYDSLKCAAKLNVAFCFELKNIEDGSCRY